MDAKQVWRAALGEPLPRQCESGLCLRNYVVPKVARGDNPCDPVSPRLLLFIFRRPQLGLLGASDFGVSGLASASAATFGSALGFFPIGKAAVIVIATMMLPIC
jgi:hypothetical protein